ncbi:polysaccharide pyruvyl transferase family protein [Variovorax boronicumulans]|jgi:polysaccharide pyruvyl transferase WcaK-like protein|uniref:polysaccharide pyruvyl transferase family protein n=1 Tax=Variovorax TaxID=34072 RepID=UPI00278A6107|nr:polysaccharide pyruvyl transferase family protein [Variovorax boronicumulans]MDQ0083746.1 polysaccharide pyruvyl transferase WcaK-like protein [Variovorax boronicumulans]
MKKILICAVPYSDNLGDGVIAASLAHIAGMKYPEAKVEFLDIAGRVAFDESNLRGGGAFEIFQKMPALLRSAIVFAYCLKNYLLGWRKQWQAAVNDADLVLIGGGQLFCDVALNFPAKLFLLSRLLRGKKVAVVSVGVTAKWSFWGKFLVKKFLRNAAPVFYATRDVDSANNLHAFFDIPRSEIKVVPDPALVCASAFSEELSPDKKWDVGICVSSLDALVMNSEYGDTRTSGSAEFFSGLAEALQAEGARVLYFTNGAAEDNKILAEISSSRAAAPGFSFVVPKRPDDLVALISACSCIAAHRLHANIVAYSLNIPSIGMNWDKKVESFFQLTDRTQYLFGLSPRREELKASVLNLLNEKNADRRRLDELKTEVIAGTHALI